MAATLFVKPLLQGWGGRDERLVGLAEALLDRNAVQARNHKTGASVL